VRQDDDARMRFPVDDVTAPLTSCELHIPEGNATVKVDIGLYLLSTPPRHQGSTRSQYHLDMLVSQWIEWSQYHLLYRVSVSLNVQFGSMKPTSVNPSH
jgi:hypothetical protein